MTDPNGISDAQLCELIAAVNRIHGFDFSSYSKASLKRRVSRVMMLQRISVDELLDMLGGSQFFQWFLDEITVNVTEIFRDPSFYECLYTHVMPFLAAQEQVAIWSAGCSSGEEAYSLAMLCELSGLGDKWSVYGTDISKEMLGEARSGVFSIRKIRSYSENYINTGLPGSLTDHFIIRNDVAAVKPHLSKRVSFSLHNLLSDPPFGQFDFICCRNVFIYFEAFMQEKVLHLFYESLAPKGFLCLGMKENIRFPEIKSKFRVIHPKTNIYQKL